MELADCTHRSNLLTLPFVCQVHCKSFFPRTYFLRKPCPFVTFFIYITESGQKEQKAILGACNRSTAFCYHIDLLRVYHPCRKRWCSDCMRIYHWSPFTPLSRAHAHAHTHINNSFLLKVRHITKGVNPSSIDQIYFTGDYLVKGFKIGVVAGMIALTVCKKFSPQSIFHSVQCKRQ